MRTVLLTGLTLLAFGLAACASVAPSSTSRKHLTAPRVLQRTAPAYPDELRLQRISGSVEVAGTVPKEGGVLRDARVVSSTDPRLEPYALEAVSKWIWSPGLQDGQPVDVEFKTTVTFAAR